MILALFILLVIIVLVSGTMAIRETWIGGRDAN